MSSSEASQQMAKGANVWFNALFDLMTHLIKPAMVYDKRATGGKVPERGPNAEIGVSGNVKDAIKIMDQPSMPPGIFTVGEMLQGLMADTVGESSSPNTAQPGLLRGGAYAFESLLQSSTGRERLTGAILETGFIEPTVIQTLIYMQQNIGPDGDIFRLRNWDAATGQEYIEEVTVTEDDLVHAYDVEVSLQEKHRNSAIDQQMRIAEYNIKKDDPHFDQFEIRHSLYADDMQARRELLPREAIQEMQEEDRALSVMERAAGAEGAASPGLPDESNPIEQGLAGAARLSGE